MNRYHDGSCIDKSKGLFLVCNAIKGVHHPVHVQKCIRGSEIKISCEAQGCEYLNFIAGVSEETSVECPHLQSIQYIKKNANVIQLQDTFLDKLVEMKRLKTETREMLRELKYKADSLGHILASAWTPASHQSQRYVFISVWIGEIHYFSQNQRLIVTFDLISHDLCCRCSHSTHTGCLHKAVAKWYLIQVMPDLFSGANSTGLNVSNINSELQDISCNLMTKYVMECKLIPSEILPEFQLESVKLPTIVPTEKSCYYCNGLLCDTLCGNGMIVSRFGVTKSVKIWKKHCSKCLLDYWANDIESGLFNFNNYLFLTIDLLLWLRNGLYEHIAISREIALIENRYQVFIEKDKILKTFFKFESMVDYNEEYKCVLCGVHPIILNFDVMRKCAFKLDGTMDSRQQFNEVIDHDHFWQQVDKSCIDEHSNANKIAPSLGFWAPWIPEKTRLDSMVYSTEFQKGSNDEGEDDYLKCLSEESLEELFSMGDLSTPRKVCKECGIKADKLTRIDCISRLKSAVQSVANIDKLFFKIWQASGGILTGTCIHGIVYSFKCLLKAESPRDYADILLSMKHPPNIVISDVPHMLAAHINKRSPNFFAPYAGRVADPSEENIKAVHEGYFQQISMPWLNRMKRKSVPGVNIKDTPIHPITLVYSKGSPGLTNSINTIPSKKKRCLDEPLW